VIDWRKPTLSQQATLFGDGVKDVVLVVAKKQVCLVNDHDVAQQAFLLTTNWTFFSAAENSSCNLNSTNMRFSSSRNAVMS
jgi:hypothetical protein